MYDLSNVNIPQKLTKEAILEKASQEEIMRYYIGVDFTINKAFRSPLRNDKVPSFVVYSLADGSLRFKDFNGAQGSCFDLVMILYKATFMEALEIIDRDFNLNIKKTTISSTYKREHKDYKPKKIEYNKKLLQFKPQLFTEKDIEYWSSYNITKETLEKYNVFSAKYIFLDKKLILRYNNYNPIYCYKFESTVKVYRPFANKGEYKWMSNVTKDDIQGYDALDFSRDTLIITKSLKDVMCLHEMGFSSIAPQAEGNRNQYEAIDNIAMHFDTIIILFDNDDTGIKGAENLKEYLSMSSKVVFIENIDNIKDISDHVKTYGLDISKNLINTLIDE